MSLHKLTAGDGYTYLTRQVAVLDATDRGASGLADYYAEKGESPGRWWGAGLTGVDLVCGSVVSEAQMKSLFGEGRHPDAEQFRLDLVGAGEPVGAAESATRLGHPFRIASGATDFAKRVAEAYVEHNLARGEAWSAAIRPEVRATLRTRVAEAMFLERYGRRPADDRERHGFMAQESRQRTTSVAGFDLTFTPVKSVSVLWGVAGGEVAREIERAHAAAVQDTLAWLEQNALFTRHGHRGVRQVRTRGLIAAAFTHRDSRAGDPNLHTHVAVSNKVQDESGKWLAVDGRVLYKANVSLSEHYNTRLEGELTSRLGLRFAEVARGGPERGRPVREVVGVDSRLSQAWSSRRRDIDLRRADLARQFQHDHGRPPTPTEAIALSQQANLETRQDKHEPRTEQEQRAAWARHAQQVLGSSTAVHQMVNNSMSAQPRRPEPSISHEWLALTAQRVVRVLEARRATWQLWHLQAEAERQARYADVPLEHLDDTVNAIVRQAIGTESVALPDPDPVHAPGRTPAQLTRADGSSVYAVHGAQRFTSQAILDAEQVILTAAARCDGPVVPPERVRQFLVSGARGPDGSVLAQEQADLVARLAGTSQRVQVALAPAGSGKTTCMRALAELWLSNGGQVLGLAPSAAAAHQLQESLSDKDAEGGEAVVPCDTLAKLAWGLEHPADAAPWASTIDASTMVIIDEAGMAGTLELAAAVRHVTDRGGCVRLVGDDRQLASVSAGGIVRDIAERYGAATLTETRRFHDPVEGAATLALRDGDPIALGFYADHGRLHVGDPSTCAEQAYTAWQADIAAGRSSVLIAPTRELVTQLNTRAQQDRLTAQSGPRESDHSGVRLADGTTLRAGDVAITRRNDRRLVLSNSNWVKNGDRWTVISLQPDGAAVMRHSNRRRTLTIPAEYVAHHVTLGYATTVHGAQGLTTDTAHTLLTGKESRRLLYVGLTRGKEANHAYISTLPQTPGEAGPDSSAAWHDLTTRPETLHPPTAVEVLTTVLAREDDAQSATSALTDESDSIPQLQELLQAAADRYRDSLHVAATDVLPAEAIQVLNETVARLAPELPEEPGWESLRSGLLLCSIEERTDPGTVLTELHTGRNLGDARDAAAVLSARLAEHQRRNTTVPESAPPPIPWLPRTPRALAEHPTWGPYLTARNTWVTRLSAQLAQAVDIWSNPDTGITPPPAWARPLIATSEPTLLGDLMLWRAIEGVDTNDLSPTGSHTKPGLPGEHQNDLRRRVAAAGAAVSDRYPLPDEVRADPWLPHVLMHLDQADRHGLDVHQALTEARGDGRDLPTETPAAALWWRVKRRLRSTDDTQSTSAKNPAADFRPDPRWAVESHTSRARIVAIHDLALDYYSGLYEHSWAPDYLERRLYPTWSRDLPELRPGYAPPGPQSAVLHLRALGVTDEELLDAGLASERAQRSGASRLTDTFRDRLVLPLYDPRRPNDVVGFVGRRNPTKDSSDWNGPKYLNTRTTAAYAKSDNLFGLDHFAARPAAAPAVVEGPLDAIALTLTSQGRFVGVAPLGTALTDDQVQLLAAHHRRTHLTPLLVFDGDTAGHTAATHAAEALYRADVPSQSLNLPTGTDPCDLLIAEPTALAEAMRSLASRAAAPHPDRLRRSPATYDRRDRTPPR